MTGRLNRAVADLVPNGAWQRGPAPGWMQVTATVEAVRPLPNEPDLLSPSVGRVVTVLLRHELARDLPLSGAWRVETRLVGPHTVRVLAVIGVRAEPPGDA